MTYTLIAINVAVFVYQLTLSPQQSQTVAYLFGVVPARYTDPAWAASVGLGLSPVPFLTTQFLHGSFFHLIGNMWMLWVFGDNVEDRMGRLGFLVFYLISGLAAGFLHLVTNFASKIPAIGASGAIAGVLAAYVALFPRAKVLTLIPIFFYPLFVELPALFFIGVWFLGQLFSGTLALFDSSGAGIAWWAHIGGFAAGLAMYRIFAGGTPRRPKVIYPWGPDGPAVIEPENDSKRRPFL